MWFVHRRRAHLCNLFDLIDAVEGHLADAVVAGELQIAPEFHGVGEDDSLRGDAELEHSLHLSGRRAVEALGGIVP